MFSHNLHSRNSESATSVQSQSLSFQVIIFMYLKQASNIHGESARTFSPSPQDIANSILPSAVEIRVAKKDLNSLPRQRNHIRPRPPDQLDTYPSSHGPHHPALEAQLCRMRPHRVLIRKVAPLQVPRLRLARSSPRYEAHCSIQSQLSECQERFTCRHGEEEAAWCPYFVSKSAA